MTPGDAQTTRDASRDHTPRCGASQPATATPRPSRPTRVPVGVAVVVGLALLAAVFAVRILIGATGFGAPDNPGIFLVRATPFAVAAVVGAALATSGVLLQSLLRNPLASPWILGLSAGAGLGVSIEIYLRQRAAGVLDVTPSFASPLFALAGAAGALALVYWLARRRGLLDPPALVLVGVMISITCGAATMFVQQLLPDAGLAASARWAMGRIPEHAELWHIGPAAALTAIGLAIAIRDHRALDIASLSDDEAASIGVNLPAIRRRMFVIAAVLSGGAVVLAGPIGFVGLVCPHAVRLIAGPRHATLLIGSALLGAAALALAELAAAAVTTNAGRIPVGVITAIIGGPLFILLLRTTMLGPARAGPGP